jgi:hypothetical protein
VMVLSRRLGHGAMSHLSYAGDGAAKVTWPRHNRSYDMRSESGSMT